MPATATTTSNALEIKGVTKSFGDAQVLHGVDLTVPEGSITALIGASGGGKSVLLKCIAGLLDADSGSISIFGNPPGEAAASGVGYLFQSDALLDSLTAWDNVALPLRETTSMPKREIAEKVNGTLERLDLGDIVGKYPGDLSGGMRRRVAVARALVLDPRLMLFDEPTTGLDPMRRNAVLELVRSYQERFGFTALIVTHDVPATFLIADHLAMLENGKTIFSGPLTELAPPYPGSLGNLLNNEDELAASILGAGDRDTLSEALPDLAEKYEEALLLEPDSSATIGERLAFPRLTANGHRKLRKEGVEISDLFQVDSLSYLVFVNGGIATLSGSLPWPPTQRAKTSSHLTEQLSLLGLATTGQ